MVMALAVLAFTSCDEDDAVGPSIWSGADKTFSKAANADWTLSANQDRLTDKVIFTRQDDRPIYNYQWWQDEFGSDAKSNELYDNFWDDSSTGSRTFTKSGGPKGVRWAILDNTGGSNWPASFDLYGELGDSTHFYSLNNVVRMLSVLKNNQVPASVRDDFNIEDSNGALLNRHWGMSNLVGKKLGVWLKEENIYFTMTFTKWGGGNGGQIEYTRSTP